MKNSTEDNQQVSRNVGSEHSSRKNEKHASGGGANLSRVRAHNERLVLSLIREEPLPRAEIARRTGLSAQTITLITRDLTNDGLIDTGPPIRGKVGQPSVPLTLKSHGAFFMGLKLGRRSAELIVINFLGQIILKREEHYHYPAPDHIVAFLEKEIPSLTEELGKSRATRLRGLGIAMPYEMWNWSETLNAPKDIMESWRNFAFENALAAVTDLPIFVENDATSACGAELTFGQGRHHSEFAYFFIGYFIGGGLVLNGSVYRGQTGNAGAYGSLPIFNRLTGTGVSQLIDTASIHLFENTVLFDNTPGSEYITHDSAIWETESSDLHAWLENLTCSLAMAIASVNSVVDVGVIIIDGGFPSSIRDQIVSLTRKALEDVDTKGIRVPDIVAGAIGPEARALGAARLPLFSCFLLDETVLTRS